jgi:predicted RNase H-like HicB family nuclease
MATATKRTFQVVLEWDERDQVWVTYVPALDTREEALANTREAIAGYLEAAAKEGLPVPAGDAPTEVVDVEVAL